MNSIYFITDRKLSKIPVIETVRQAISGGVKIIQYREKEYTTKSVIEEANEIKKICMKNNVTFLINDRVDVCLAVDADGVHLGQDDMPYSIARKLLKNKIIGLTVHDLKEAKEAERIGADYISVSPIFHTDTKKDAGKPAGIGLIKEIKKEVKIPIVAIGGINRENLRSVIEARADSIAMISAVVTKENIEKEVGGIIKDMKKWALKWKFRDKTCESTDCSDCLF